MTAPLLNLLPRGRLVLLADGLVAVWTVAWIIIGIQVGSNVNDLRRLSVSVEKAGQAVEAAGSLLGSLQSVPLIGKRFGQVATKVVAAGRSAEASGRASHKSIDSLSVLLAVAVALVPTGPLLAFYLPLRLIRYRIGRAP